MSLPETLVPGELLPPIPDFLLSPDMWPQFTAWLRSMDVHPHARSYWLRRVAAYQGRKLNRSDYAEARADLFPRVEE